MKSLQGMGKYAFRYEKPLAFALSTAVQKLFQKTFHNLFLIPKPKRVVVCKHKTQGRWSGLVPARHDRAADVLAACNRLVAKVLAVAVFDTTFHLTMSEVAKTYALPYALCEQHHLHRFGFHGIAHQFVSGRLIECIDKVGKSSRCITCRLGNGASICAVKDGRSIGTSMVMTPMEGLVMGTRSGDVDPGILLYLQQTLGMKPEELNEILNHKSGLLGISGISSDVRDIESAAPGGDKRAEFALELFAYRAAKTIGAYAVALEGVDAIAFSGGIGENSASMRERICRRLGFIGVEIDNDRNAIALLGEAMKISTDGGLIEVWVIKADGSLQIALETRNHLSQ